MDIDSKNALKTYIKIWHAENICLQKSFNISDKLTSFAYFELFSFEFFF